MCLLIIEILFLVAGLMLLITGSIPQKFFAFLFGKGIYQLEPTKARLLGLLLVTPLPVAFLAGIVAGLILPEDAVGIASGVEIVWDLIVFVTAIVIARKIRQKPSQAPAAIVTPENTPPS